MGLTFADPKTFAVDEMRYVGSFIIDGKRPNFYIMRTASITPSDLRTGNLSAILTEIENIYRDNEKPTVEEVSRRLLAHLPQAESIIQVNAGLEYARKMVETVAKMGANTFAEFSQYEEAMYKLVIGRKIAPEKILAMAQELAAQVSDPIAYAEKLREKIVQIIHAPRGGVEVYREKEQINLFDELQERARKNIGKVVLSLPPEWGLNRYVPMLMPGMLTVLAGRTGDGKSSLAARIAEYNAMAGNHALYIHAEDSEEVVFARMTCRYTAASWHELMRGDPRNKYQEMKELRKKWRGTYTTMYAGGVSYDILEANIQQWIHQTYASLGSTEANLIVVWDYIQKTPITVSNGRNLANEYQAIVARVRDLAIRHNVHVVIVSQLTDTESSDRLRMDSSSHIEKQAQLVIAIQRNKIKKPEDQIMHHIEGRNVAVAMVGEYSPWMKLQIYKTNNTRAGASEVFFNRFMAITPEWYRYNRYNFDKLSEPVIIQEPSAEELDAIRRLHIAYERTISAKDELPV